MEPVHFVPPTLGQYIRKARESHSPKMTQQQLADAVGRKLGEPFTKNMVTKIEGDNRDLSFREAVAFADALSVDLGPMADDIYRHDPVELVSEAFSLLSHHHFNLIKSGSGDVRRRIIVIGSQLRSARIDADSVTAFLSVYEKVIRELETSDSLVRKASQSCNKAESLLSNALRGIDDGSA